MSDQLQVGDKIQLEVLSLKWWAKYPLLHSILSVFFKDRKAKPELQTFTVTDTHGTHLNISPATVSTNKGKADAET